MTPAPQLKQTVMANFSATHNTASPGRVVILVAPDFEEAPLVHCLSQMRGGGLTVLLVSAVAGLISSRYGLTIRPDVLIDQVLLAAPPRLVIVSGGRACALALMADPRIHQLIDTALSSGGYIAATATAQAAVTGAGVPTPSLKARFMTQGRLEPGDFVSRLANLALGPL